MSLFIVSGAQFGLPPPGFGGGPRPVPHLVPASGVPSSSGVPPISGMPPSGMPYPGIPPMPMMGPPPLGGLGVPPSMPPFRPPMPFMPPVMPVGGFQSAPIQTGANDDVWVENTTAEGKSYYYSMRTRETRWDRPEGVTIVRQGEMDGTIKNTASTAAPLLAASLNEQPVAALMNPEVAAWTEYHNPEGKAYYHNINTCETTWDKPKVLIDWESKCNLLNLFLEQLQNGKVNNNVIKSDSVITVANPIVSYL